MLPSASLRDSIVALKSRRHSKLGGIRTPQKEPLREHRTVHPAVFQPRQRPLGNLQSPHGPCRQGFGWPQPRSQLICAFPGPTLSSLPRPCPTQVLTAACYLAFARTAPLPQVSRPVERSPPAGPLRRRLRENPPCQPRRPETNLQAYGAG